MSRARKRTDGSQCLIAGAEGIRTAAPFLSFLSDCLTGSGYKGRVAGLSPRGRSSDQNFARQVFQRLLHFGRLQRGGTEDHPMGAGGAILLDHPTMVPAAFGQLFGRRVGRISIALKSRPAATHRRFSVASSLPRPSGPNSEGIHPSPNAPPFLSARSQLGPVDFEPI